jgi:hypothetical protein
MKFVKICSCAKGGSHFSEECWTLSDADFTPPSPAGYSVTETMGATGVLMMHHPAGYKDEWHCAPVPVLGTVLSGTIRIETSDGDVRLLSPSDQFLAADLHGSGHRMEEVNGRAYDLALVLLDGIPDMLPRRQSE